MELCKEVASEILFLCHMLISEQKLKFHVLSKIINLICLWSSVTVKLIEAYLVKKVPRILQNPKPLLL